LAQEAQGKEARGIQEQGAQGNLQQMGPSHGEQQGSGKEAPGTGAQGSQKARGMEEQGIQRARGSVSGQLKVSPQGKEAQGMEALESQKEGMEEQGTAAQGTQKAPGTVCEQLGV
jgi:hypothetical protein